MKNNLLFYLTKHKTIAPIIIFLGLGIGIYSSCLQRSKKDINNVDRNRVTIANSNFNKSPVVVDSPGAVVAENINVSTKKSQRHLMKIMINQIEDQLKKYDRKDAIVFYQMGDSEAYRFSSEIASFVKSKGLEVKGPFAGMFRGDSDVEQWMFIDEKGIEEKGILIFSIESQKK